MKLNKLGQLSRCQSTIHSKNTCQYSFTDRSITNQYRYQILKKTIYHQHLQYVTSKETILHKFLAFASILFREPPVGHHCSLSPCRRVRAKQQRNHGRVVERRTETENPLASHPFGYPSSQSHSRSRFALTRVLRSPLHLSHSSTGPTPAAYPRLLPPDK